MKNQNPLKSFNGRHFLLFIGLLFFLSGCCGLRGGIKQMKNHKIEKAKKTFKRAKKRKVCKEGAEFYLIQIDVDQNRDIENWIEANENLCKLEKEVNLLSISKQRKLERFDASRGDIAKFGARLRKHTYERMSEGATVTQLLALEASADCWEEDTLDSLRRRIPNKTINPIQEVYDDELDKKWKSPPLQLPTEEQIRSGKGYSCRALFGGGRFNISYDDATIIAQQYSNFVLPINYEAFWMIRRNIWSIFKTYNSYCDMDKFKKDHPYSWIADDCWFDTAKDTLCLSDLKPLLTFHRNNPHTALDYSICFQILCLMSNESGLKGLNAVELKQVVDVEMMLSLHTQLRGCGPRDKTEKLIKKVEYLIKKYEHHEVVYDLAVETLDYFATARDYAAAKEALETFRPLFTDASVCPSDYDFQINKQEWFDTFTALLNRAIVEQIIPKPTYIWNTSNDEYALISWGETDEVFFVRRDIETRGVQIMTSKLKDTIWTTPRAVEKLSISDDVVLLSISANGREMLLKAGGNLWRSYRLKVGRQWSNPEEIPVRGKFALTGWLSANDSLLLTEYYALPPSAMLAAKTDLAVSVLQENDSYGRMRSLGEKVNLLLSNEGNPMMALGGRQLFYTSNKRNGGLGNKDMYAINLGKPNNWSTLNESKNIGIPLNTIYDDHGLTYFSEYTGKAYFHRKNRCSKDMDIWEVGLSQGLFPKNAMRLAGLVLDENGKPIGGGFMEFTPNYQLNVHAKIISNKGTYTYTVADSTEVVRLFPEIPGYYSERDTTHFLANKPKGGIIRDTFILTSFDYIRKYFKLEHSTFYNGTSRFDNEKKAYPELTRLAKIATRMGADLVLKGHTDNTGPASGHEKLSRDRAESVKQFLVKKCGFDANRIEVLYFGSSKPNCSNDTEEGRRCNRRVEVVFKMPELLKGK